MFNQTVRGLFRAPLARPVLPARSDSHACLDCGPAPHGTGVIDVVRGGKVDVAI